MRKGTSVMEQYCASFGDAPFTSLDLQQRMLRGITARRGVIKPYHHTGSVGSIAYKLAKVHYIKRLGTKNDRRLYQYVGELNGSEHGK